jgi:hypothetical protein
LSRARAFHLVELVSAAAKLVFTCEKKNAPSLYWLITISTDLKSQQSIVPGDEDKAMSDKRDIMHPSPAHPSPITSILTIFSTSPKKEGTSAFVTF